MSKVDEDRNPFILPDSQSSSSGPLVCPKCRKADYGGRKVDGVITYRCRTDGCGNSWQGGGVGLTPPDNTIPQVPQTVHVDFEIDPRTKDIREVRRPVSTTPAFRTGALVPKDEE